MATKTLVFQAPSGMTLTASVFTIASDTPIQSGIVCTEEANAKGWYTAAMTTTLASAGSSPGVHRVSVFSGAVPVAAWYVDLEESARRFPCTDVPARINFNGYVAANLMLWLNTAPLGLSSQRVVADTRAFLGTAITEGAAGRIAAAFQNFFNVASPTGTVNSLPAALPGSNNGLLVAGTNAATTFNGLEVGDLSGGNVQFRDDLQVDGSIQAGSNAVPYNSNWTSSIRNAVYSAAVATYGAATGTFGKLFADSLTGHTPQSGDSYLIVSHGTNGNAAIRSLLDTLESRLTASRALLLDNLDVGGLVASQADVQALNQSASRRLVIQTSSQYERPDGPDAEYEVEVRTYDETGAAVDADATPTLTATGIVSGDLSANLSSASTPATGVYRWIYTVSDSHPIEQVRFDAQATIGSSAFTIATYSQVVDFVAITWTATHAAMLTAVYNKLPSKSYLVGTNNSDGDVQMDEATGNFPGSVGSINGVTFPTNFGLLSIDGSGYVELKDGSLVTGKLGTFVLTKGTHIVGFNDVSAAGVWSHGTRTLTAFSFEVTVGGYAAGMSPEDQVDLGGLSTFDPNTQPVTVGGYGAGMSPQEQVPTADQNADALLDRANAIGFGVTIRKLLRLVGAVLGGKTSGAGTGTETFRDISDTKNVVTATVDANGNRSSITLDLD